MRGDSASRWPTVTNIFLTILYGTAGLLLWAAL